MTEDLSVLARQRAEDAALVEVLRLAWPNHVEPVAAADRIEQLGQDLAEACHARDGLLARLEALSPAVEVEGTGAVLGGDLDYWNERFGERVMCLSVPGKDEHGVQHITATFASGDSCRASSPSIDRAWQLLAGVADERRAEAGKP